MQQTQIHISDTFFSKASRYFNGIDGAIKEAVQNAYRSYLPLSGKRPAIHITGIEDGLSLVIEDEGRGIQDIGAALSIADSRWGDNVEEEQDPAGMGLCGVLAACREATIQSAFGMLTIDCEKFFHSSEYRETLLDNIVDDVRSVGTYVRLDMLSSPLKLYHVKEACKYYWNSDIFLNEEHISRPHRDIEELIEDYQGYRVMYHKYSTSWSRGVRVVWHGQYIDVSHSSLGAREITLSCGEKVNISFHVPTPRGSLYIVVDGGEPPVTPKLPDRESLVYDQKTQDFLWGLAEHLIVKAADEWAEGLEENNFLYRFRSDSRNLPVPVRGAIIRRKFPGRIAVDIPAIDEHGCSDSPAGSLLVLDDKPLLRMDRAFVRFSDGKWYPLDVSDAQSYSLAGSFADGGRGGAYPGTVEHESAVVPERLVIDVSHSFGNEVKVRSAVVVFHVPREAPDREYLRSFDMLVDEPSIKTMIYGFDLDDGQLPSGVDDLDRVDNPDEVVAQADEVNEAWVPGFISTNGTPSYGDGDDILWIGNRKVLVGMTYAVSHVYWAAELDETLDEDTLTLWFDAIRTAISGTAYVFDQVYRLLTTALPERGDLYSVSHKIERLEFDHENKQLTIKLMDEDPIVKTFSM